jgi:hypothetical protein
MRQRWFGATGQRVPEIVVEGDATVPVGDALVLDDVTDHERLRSEYEKGTPIVVRAGDAESIKRALARPEVAAVVVPESARELLDLDLTELTYG